MSAIHEAIDYLLARDTSDAGARMRQAVLADAHPRDKDDHDPIPEHLPAVVTGNEPDTPERRHAAAKADLARAQAAMDKANAENPPAPALEPEPLEPEPARY